MLVLTRKERETIHVGNDITITIVRIGPEIVRLGIDAPKEINIVRGELLRRAETSDKPACWDVNGYEVND